MTGSEENGWEPPDELRARQERELGVHYALASMEDALAREAVAVGLMMRATGIELDPLTFVVTRVLENKEYAGYVAKRTHYFEVPVCRSTEEFLGRDGFTRPIVLALEMAPAKDIEAIPGLKIDREVAPELLKESGWRRLRDHLLSFLLPTAWADERKFEVFLSPIKPSRAS